ncbi:hypothetical protein [Actinokineospora iranica]|uniref:Uncharacterized protein n=1 Tax=Actinokineospora iranica TaxID=1271860 RepID=A0A1G6ZBG8_9PSEU|nr:hypothetical protein [Actinokineospora iranica]SDD99968.1 hypothetical protein SAMN05216174_1283 [Actinokineospora iranica]
MDQEIGGLTFEQTDDERTEHLDDYGLVQLKAHGEHLVAIEPNGWVGNGPEVARTLSSPTDLFFSVERERAPTLAGHGRTDHGALRSDVHRAVCWGERLLHGWVGGGDDEFPLKHLCSASLAAMERQTGLSFDPGWLADSLPTYRISACTPLSGAGVCSG